MVYEEDIKLTLMGESLTVNDLARKFPNKKEILIQDYKRMVRNGMLSTKKIGNRIYLSLSVPKSDISLKMIMSSLPLAEKRAESYMKKLHQSKPIFLDQEIRDGEKTSFRMNQKNKRNLDRIIVIINDLVSRSVALTYAQCLNSLPKGSEKVVRQYHKNAIRTIRMITDQLIKEHQDTESQLGAYLYYGINGYNHLTTLEFMNRNNY